MQTTFSEWNCLAIERLYCNTHLPMNPTHFEKALLMAKFQFGHPPNQPEGMSSGKEWFVLVVLPIAQRRVRGAIRRLHFLAVHFVVYQSKVSDHNEMLNGADA
jgi:hypothetical protein